MVGHVYVYTGDGREKAAAALGSAMKAIGAGFKVFVTQFFKEAGDKPLQALEKISDQVLLREYGERHPVANEIKEEDRQKALEVLHEICGVIHSGDYQLVILDDANIAVCHGVLTVEDLLSLIDLKPKHVDLIITGECAAPQIMERADLVTDMKAVKMGPELCIGAMNR
jgi:cob(I)alamin adenosyltransferase